MKSNHEKILKNTQIKLKVKLNPTEEQIKVENSIRNIMGEKITIKKSENDYLIVEDDLSSLYLINKLIIKNEFDELSKNILEKNKTDTEIKFFVNKQAAYNKNFHIIDENMSPLGDIEITIETDNSEEVIEWITS
ncbi:MAG: hypothetical protein E7Z85_02895 [Methanosphaera stadtmanae]|nr:hypothetical protein [Methanosphaera stadtmanae]